MLFLSSSQWHSNAREKFSTEIFLHFSENICESWKENKANDDQPVVLSALVQLQYGYSAPDPSKTSELSACPWMAMLSAGLLVSQEEQRRVAYVQLAASNNKIQYVHKFTH